MAIPGYALVREERRFDLKAGRNLLRVPDVPALIDPTTVSFASLTDPSGTRVIEQSFEFDLTSTQKLLSRYLEREITVEQPRGQGVGSFTGTLVGTQGGLTLKAADGSVRVVNGYSGVTLPSLPGGLISRPTLVWDIESGTRRHPRRAHRLPDGGRDLVDRLQRHLHGARARPVPARRRRVGHDRQPVGRDLRGREAQAGRGRRAPRAAARLPRRRAGLDDARAGGQGAGLRGEGLLRVPPLHARAPDDARAELHQADRALPHRRGRGLREDARLLRAGLRLRLLRLAHDRPQLRRPVQPQGGRLPADEERRRPTGSACRCRRGSCASPSATTRTAAWNSSART